MKTIAKLKTTLYLEILDHTCFPGMEQLRIPDFKILET